MPYQENTNELSWDAVTLQSEARHSFFTNDIVQILLITNILLCLLSLGLLGYFVRQEENIIILHYNVYFGVDIQGSWWQAYLFPLASIFFTLLHTFLSYHFYQKSERIASYLMLLGGCLLSFGIVIVSISVAVINY